MRRRNAKTIDSDPSSTTCFLPFVCDLKGNVTREFHDQLACATSGRALVDSVDARSLNRFLDAVATQRSAVTQEMNTRSGASAGTLQFHGALTHNGILIIAAINPGHAITDAAKIDKHEELRQFPDNKEELRADEIEVSCPALISLNQEREKRLTRVFHDLRNPVSSILSSCEYLTIYGQHNLDPEQLELIRAIEASAQKLLNLTENKGQAGTYVRAAGGNDIR